MQPESGRNLPPRNATERTAFSAVYDLLQEAISDKIFPGCAFGVLQGSNIRILDALGRQTYDSDAPSIEPSSVFDLASLTKVLATTSMAMLLFDRQQLNLDQPLTDILPEFASGTAPAGIDEDARHSVTIRHLLAHCSGLAGYARLFEFAHSREELLNACLHMPLEHLPSAVAEYSDIGFILLGRALETLAGETIDNFCRREVFAPLQMNHTGFLPSPDTWPSIPPTERDTAFRLRIIQGEVQDENCWVMGGISGHAGLFGNVLDALKFARCLIAPASSADDKLLFRPDTIKLFSTRTGMPPASSRALGWDTPSSPSSSGNYFSSDSIGHLGYAGTSIWIDRVKGVAVVLLTNRTWPSRDNQGIRRIRPIFHDRIWQALIPQLP